MSQARNIHKLIQQMRDELSANWRGWGEEIYRKRSERDKTCEELQAKIRETFPADFPEQREEPL